MAGAPRLLLLLLPPVARLGLPLTTLPGPFSNYPVLLFPDIYKRYSEPRFIGNQATSYRLLTLPLSCPMPAANPRLYYAPPAWAPMVADDFHQLPRSTRPLRKFALYPSSLLPLWHKLLALPLPKNRKLCAIDRPGHCIPYYYPPKTTRTKATQMPTIHTIRTMYTVSLSELVSLSQVKDSQKTLTVHPVHIPPYDSNEMICMQRSPIPFATGSTVFLLRSTKPPVITGNKAPNDGAAAENTSSNHPITQNTSWNGATTAENTSSDILAFDNTSSDNCPVLKTAPLPTKIENPRLIRKEGKRESQLALLKRMEWLEKEQAKVQQKLVEAINADSDDDDDNKNDGASRDAATGDATDDDAAGDVDGEDATDDDVDGGVDVPGVPTGDKSKNGGRLNVEAYRGLVGVMKEDKVQFSNGAPATASVGRYTRFFELEPNYQDMVPTRRMTDSDAKIMKKNITPGKKLSGRIQNARVIPYSTLGLTQHHQDATNWLNAPGPFQNIPVATLGPGEVTGVPVTLSRRAEAPLAFSVGPLSTRVRAPPDVSAAHHPLPPLCRTRSTHDPRPTPCCSRGPDARHAAGWRPRAADHQGCGQGRTAFAPIDPAQHATIHSLCEAIAADSGYPVRVTAVTSNIPFRNQIKCLEEICTNCAPKHVNWKQFLLANEIRPERVGIVDTFASIDPDELDILLPCIRADANFNTNQGLGF
ncbi:hypothetical protein FQN51_007019 [Onygenales sp. PD_10]|nr:hypothetical protein FQN51_007019 [Onygenales sp. PD_10]